MIVTANNIKSNLPNVNPPKGLLLSIGASVDDFKNTEAAIRSNYYDGFARELKPVIRARLGSYLEDTTYETFNNDELCPEMPVPENIAKKIRLEVGSGVPVQHDGVALVHAGRKGTVAPLHFDWDHDNVLHVNITGRKTFFFFPPEAGWLLMPVVNTSSFCVPRLSVEDRKSLLKMLGGFEVTIEPNEAVLFPSMWWHSVLYDEASIGVSVRFSQRTDLRPFSVLPRSWWLQRVVNELFNSEDREGAKIVLQSLGAVFFAQYPSWRDRYHAFNEFCSEYLGKVGKERGTRYWVGENFNAEVMLADFELEELYTLPEAADEENEKLPTVKDYLFASSPELVQSELADNLARYALATRNGLAPKRGLISVGNSVKA